MTLIDCREAESAVSELAMDGEPWQQRAKKAGLSQKVLAQLLGVHVNTVSLQLRGKWESGVPQYVKAVIYAWEQLSQEQRDAMVKAAAERIYEPE